MYVLAYIIINFQSVDNNKDFVLFSVIYLVSIQLAKFLQQIFTFGIFLNVPSAIENFN